MTRETFALFSYFYCLSLGLIPLKLVFNYVMCAEYEAVELIGCFLYIFSCSHRYVCIPTCMLRCVLDRCLVTITALFCESSSIYNFLMFLYVFFQNTYETRYLSVCLFICLSVCLAVWLSVRPSIHPSIHPSINSSIHPSVQSTHPFTHEASFIIKTQSSGFWRVSSRFKQDSSEMV